MGGGLFGWSPIWVEAFMVGGLFCWSPSWLEAVFVGGPHHQLPCRQCSTMSLVLPDADFELIQGYVLCNVNRCNMFSLQHFLILKHLHLMKGERPPENISP